MSSHKNIFEVDRDGFRGLMLLKDKTFIIRELVANVFDEKSVTRCNVDTFYNRGVAKIIIEDDSPEGFRDLRDAYTLFRECYKRPDPTYRGRFNKGEKEVIAISERAIIQTTKGTIIFDKSGRHERRIKRLKGTRVEVDIKMKELEYKDILTYVNLLIIPEHITFYVNGKALNHIKCHKSFTTTLMTEFQKEDRMVKSERKTDVCLYDKRDGKSNLYELGMPVCEIDCEWSIDVNQRVPMSSDRDTVSQAYLQDLFAEVLNQTYQEIKPEQASNLWVRDATADDRVSRDAVKQVVKQRWGDKVVVASPNDPVSIDDAISRGYNVVYGSELSKEEWENVRESGAMPSSHEMFGSGIATDCEDIEPDENMRAVAKFSKELQKDVFGIEIEVRFVKSKQMTANACYGRRSLTFNVTKLGKGWFKSTEKNYIVDERILDLILHELAHEGGMHTEMGYHNALTKICAHLVMCALWDRKMFERDAFDSMKIDTSKMTPEEKKKYEEEAKDGLSALFG